MIRRTDGWWLLAAPLYLTIGTLRHEGAHALTALAEGAQVTRFVFWPSLRQHRLYWGYVSFHGPTTWLTFAAPYLADLLTYAVCFVLCWRLKPHPRWLWLNLLIVGLVSPLVNSLYNYQGGLWRPYNDVARLLAALPDPVVHGYFIGTLLLYGIGLWLLCKRAWPGYGVGAQT